MQKIILIRKKNNIIALMLKNLEKKNNKLENILREKIKKK